METTLANRALCLIQSADSERTYLIDALGVPTLEPLRPLLESERIVGGHSLRACWARELKLTLDKSEQTSAWAQRPLTVEQVEYAALDAEVLLALEEALAQGGELEQNPRRQLVARTMRMSTRGSLPKR